MLLRISIVHFFLLQYYKVWIYQSLCNHYSLKNISIFSITSKAAMSNSDTFVCGHKFPFLYAQECDC